jgi:hypothetical protein
MKDNREMMKRLLLVWMATAFFLAHAEEVRPLKDVLGTDPSESAQPKADMLPGYSRAFGEAPGGSVEGLMMGGVMPRSADIQDLPDYQSAGAQLLNRYCTQCHGLPTPDQHSAEGWFPVVQRMKTRMKWMTLYSSIKFEEPTAAEILSINQYLTEYARKPESSAP